MNYNPKGQAMKSIEMTVLRALQFIKLWDEGIVRDKWTGKYNNWDDLDPKAYRKILGEAAYSRQNIIQEMFRRYQSKQLHQEVLDLAENLNLDALPAKRRKELTDGLNGISKKLSS